MTSSQKNDMILEQVESWRYIHNNVKDPGRPEWRSPQEPAFATLHHISLKNV